MTYLMSVLMQGLLLGFVLVASNPSPYFAALGLVVVAAMGCGLIAMSGGMFLGLVMFLVYLGGMLVVFAYSSALASELHPRVWESWPVLSNSLVYTTGVVYGASVFWEGWDGWSWPSVEGWEMSLVRGDFCGAAGLYSAGGWLLVISGWVLLLTLLVVLELVRGGGRGAVRAV